MEPQANGRHQEAFEASAHLLRREAVRSRWLLAHQGRRSRTGRVGRPAGTLSVARRRGAALDRPPFKVLGDRTLVLLNRVQPQQPYDLPLSPRQISLRQQHHQQPTLRAAAPCPHPRRLPRSQQERPPRSPGAGPFRPAQLARPARSRAGGRPRHRHEQRLADGHPCAARRSGGAGEPRRPGAPGSCRCKSGPGRGGRRGLIGRCSPPIREFVLATGYACARPTPVAQVEVVRLGADIGIRCGLRPACCSRVRSSCAR